MISTELNIAAASLTVGINIVIAAVSYWHKPIRLNLTTYFLWGALDFVAAASLFVRGGEWLLPAACAVGCFTVIVPLMRSGFFRWTRLDTVITLMVAVSIVIWMFVSSTAATVVATAGVVIASAPQARQILRRPAEARIWIWATYVFANTLAIVAGKDWSIQERLFPSCCAATSMILLFLSLRKLRLANSNVA